MCWDMCLPPISPDLIRDIQKRRNQYSFYDYDDDESPSDRDSPITQCPGRYDSIERFGWPEEEFDVFSVTKEC